MTELVMATVSALKCFYKVPKKQTTINRKKPKSSHRSKWKWGVSALVILSAYIWAFWAFFVSPTAFRWQALYGDKKYPNGYEIQGIDISHYQGDIDWTLVKTATINECPIRFVLIKATEGASIVDENFKENFFQAREHGLIRGAYHFWSKRSSAKEQAQHFLNNVSLERGDLPPILDVEHKPKNKPVEEFQKDILEWLDIMEKTYGVKPIIYTYLNFKMKYLSDKRFTDYPFWIAHYYVEEMKYQGPWKFWQHTDAGRLPGIEGEVDFNIYNGSFYDLQKLCLQD